MQVYAAGFCIFRGVLWHDQNIGSK